MLIDLNAQFVRARELILKDDAQEKDVILAENIFHALLNIEHAAFAPKTDNSQTLFYAAVAANKRKHVALAKILYELSANVTENAFAKLAPLNNLAILLKSEGDKKSAAEVYRRILNECFPNGKLACEMEKERAEVILNLGTCYVSNGTPQIALDIFKDCEKILKDDPKLKWNKALCFLEKGDFERGFDLYQYGDGARPNKRNYPGEPTMWRGEAYTKVIVIGEQGIGDEIMFASCIPDLQRIGCEVIFDCHERLADLFRNSFGIRCYGTREQNGLRWEEKVDHKIPVGDLARFFRKKWEDFPGTPYIKHDESLSQLIPEKKDDELWLGISWRGGTRLSNKLSRTIKLTQMSPLLSLKSSKKIRWVSLQYHEGAKKEVEEFNQSSEVKIEHWPEIMKDYDLTAALLSKIDLVISVPQSVVHLAGAMGVKTLQLNPIESMWQAGVYGNPVMPWYKSVTNLWQTKNDSWDDVIEEAKTLTEEILENKEC